MIPTPIQKLKINGQEVTVRELRWTDAREFLNRLAQQAGAFFETTESPETGISVKFVFDLPRLVKVVQESGALADFLLLKATGQPESWLGEISLPEGLTVLEAALALNVNPEVIAALKKTVAAVAGAMGSGKTSEAAATPASVTS